MYRIEKYWKHKGLKCVVLQQFSGHRCGYVGVGESHILFNKDYNEDVPELKKSYDNVMKGPVGKRSPITVILATSGRISPNIVFNVHGGITFSSKESTSVYPMPTDDPTWWFGFDCAHLGDAKDTSVMCKCQKDIYKSVPDRGVVRSLEYCESECNSLAEQLSEVQGE